MINSYSLKKAWSKLSQARHERDLLPVELSDVEFSILCLIAHNEGTVSINKILHHPYFNNGKLSISTIKRAVEKLAKDDLIESKPNPRDSRERFLTVKEQL